MNESRGGQVEERSSCGRPLAPGAAFCRHCGTRRQEPAPSPPAPPEPPPPAATPTSSSAAATTPAPAPERWSGRTARTALFAVCACLLIGAGAAAALVLLGDDESTTTDVRPGAAATVPVGEAPLAESGEADSGGAPPGFPGDDWSQMAGEIQTVLLAFHEDLVAERFRDAWSLLSARKRSQTLREDGYAKWMRAQSSLVPYLAPAGLTVRIDGLEADGVARVFVAGMDWSAPGASCREWSGLTWARYEAGAWAYDPGYSTTPERERAWKGRYDRLLGAAC